MHVRCRTDVKEAYAARAIAAQCVTAPALAV